MDEVQLPRITNGVDPQVVQVLQQLSEQLGKVATATDRTADSAEAQEGALGKMGDKIKAVYGDLASFAGKVIETADAIAALATEQSRLDTQSARLNLDFDQAAAAAGRFADETDAMRVATTAAESGLRLTQTELDGFMRRAGQYAQATGVEMREATQKLTEALMAGSQEGLNRFGGELARTAEGGSTLGERLRALTTDATSMAAATDDAASSMERARDNFDDMKRAAAAAFTGQLNAAGLLNRALGDAGTGADDTSDKLRALGRLGADTVQLIGGTIGTVLGGIAYTASSAYASALGIYSALDRLAHGGSVADVRAAYAAGEAEGLATRDTIEGFTTRSMGAVEDVMSGRTGDEARDRDTEAAQARRDQATADRILAETLRSAGFNPDGTRRGRGARDRRAGGGAANDNASAIAAELARAIAENLPAKLEAQSAMDEAAALIANNEGKDASRRAMAEGGLARARGEGRVADDGTLLAQSLETKARAEENRVRREVSRERSLSDELERQFTRRTTLAQEMASGIRSAYDKMASGAGAAYAAIVKGGDDLGATLRQILSDTLLSIGQEAAVKALLNVAEGLAAVATYRYDAAASHFAAAGVYGAVAVAAGIGASVAAPGGQTAAAGGGAPQRPTQSGREATGGNGGGPTVVNNFYNAPVIDGRTSTRAEVGTEMRRGYLDRDARRTQGARRAA